MRVLVAGAAGMLAREVIESCQRRGHEVTALGRARLDITDPRSIQDAISRTLVSRTTGSSSAIARGLNAFATSRR